MNATPATIRAADGYDYYHNLTTWLSFDPVRRALNQAISGDPEQSWMDFVRNNYPQFSHCLSLNCGHGWVERALFAKGCMRFVTGTDIDQNLLSTAEAEAKAVQMPARYLQMDINTDPLPGDAIDLVLNHAAMHHVARVDRVLRQICALLPEDGLFISYDYTGPHRNQYEYEFWSRMVEFNQCQPEHLKNTNLTYPHLPTMLVMDPSEAIHSELLLDHINRYFHVDYCVPLGGKFAYQLMHDHANLNAHQQTPEGQALIAEILRIDAEITRADPQRSLFTFIVMRPNKSILADEHQLAQWTREEDEREQLALENGGLYYPKTALQIITEELAMARYLLSLRPEA